MVLLGLTGSRLTFKLFMSSTILNSIPGIVLQLVLIPTVMLALNRTGLVRFRKLESAKQEVAK
jgi:hypothetical protein